MTLRKLTIVPMLALSLFAVGCGDDCESFCEDGKECEGADKDRDCAKECEDLRKAAEDAGCEEEFDDLMDCASGVDDVCKEDSSECASEITKYAACLADSAE